MFIDIPFCPQGTIVIGPDRRAIFFIESRVLRHVTSPEILSMFHFNLDRLVVLPSPVLDLLPKGDPIDGNSVFAGKAPAGALLEAGGKVYLVDKKVLRHITTGEILEQLGFRWDHILWNQNLQSYSFGDPIFSILSDNPPDGLVFGTTDRIYYIENRELHHVIDPETLVYWQLDKRPIIMVTDDELNRYGHAVNVDARPIFEAFELTRANNILLARSPEGKGPKILYIEDMVPYIDRGAGYPRAHLILGSFVEAGATVTFYPLLLKEGDLTQIYGSIPNSVEVMLDYGRERLEDFLLGRKGYFDIIFVSRPTNMKEFKKVMARHPDLFSDSKIIYDAEAIFAEREVIKSTVLGSPKTESEARQLLEEEISLAQHVDAVVAVSENDKRTFESYGIRNIYVLGYALTPKPTSAVFDQRRNILFLGPVFDGSPNADAVLHFAENILPEIRKEIDVKFVVAGNNQSDQVCSLASKDIEVAGVIGDLYPLFNEARLFVIPTRFAAGIPIKAYEAASYGVPIVATPLIANQLGCLNGEAILIGRDDQDFARKCIALFKNEDLWQSLRTQALRKIEQDANPDIFRKKVAELISI